MIFTINNCAVDTGTFEIRRDGERIAAEPQVFDLLILLLKNRDRVVTRDEIFEQVWHGRIVSDAALSSRIKAARRAIGDDGQSQDCIRTIRRRGFRVVAEVEESAAAPGSFADTDGSPDLPSRRSAAALQMPAGPGIAVLSFEPLSEGPVAEFFCKAIADEITAALIRFSELRVAARSAVAPYDGEENGALEIGPKIGVEYLLQGSLQVTDDRARVTTRLLRPRDGRLLWAETYERPLAPAEIFEVQDDIAGKVVAAIASVSSGAIAREVMDRVRGKPPSSLSAYEATVRASEIMTSGFTADSHLATRESLEAVVETEPGYASAWAMLAWTHSIEHTEGHNRRLETDPLKRALEAARRAVELAPENPIAHFAMARAAYLSRDLELFRQEAEVALSLNPHDPFLLGCLGNWLAFSGSWGEGTAYVRKAIALNPKVYPRWWHAALGKDHYRRGEYRDALSEFKRINLPNWWWNQVELAYTYGQLGDAQNAGAAVRALMKAYPPVSMWASQFWSTRSSISRNPSSTTRSTALSKRACPARPEEHRP